jgi:hypothetical protein
LNLRRISWGRVLGLTSLVICLVIKTLICMGYDIWAGAGRVKKKGKTAPTMRNLIQAGENLVGISLLLDKNSFHRISPIEHPPEPDVFPRTALKRILVTFLRRKRSPLPNPCEGKITKGCTRCRIQDAEIWMQPLWNQGLIGGELHTNP